MRSPPLTKPLFIECLDCNSDFDCMEGLVCFSREGTEEVPGCQTTKHDYPGADFCVNATFLMANEKEAKIDQDAGMEAEIEDVAWDAAVNGINSATPTQASYTFDPTEILETEEPSMEATEMHSTTMASTETYSPSDEMVMQTLPSLSIIFDPVFPLSECAGGKSSPLLMCILFSGFHLCVTDYFADFEFLFCRL